MRLAIWSTTTPRENSTHSEMFRRQLEEVELAERIGIDQIWFFEHHLQPTAPVPSPNLLIAAAAPTTQRIRFSSMVNVLPLRHPRLVAEEAYCRQSQRPQWAREKFRGARERPPAPQWHRATGGGARPTRRRACGDPLP